MESHTNNFDDLFSNDVDFDTAYSQFTADFALNYEGLDNDKNKPTTAAPSSFFNSSEGSSTSYFNRGSSASTSSSSHVSTTGSRQRNAIPNGSVASAFASLLNEKESWALTDFLDRVSVDPNFLFDPKLAEGLLNVELEDDEDDTDDTNVHRTAAGPSGGSNPPLAFASDPNFPPFRKDDDPIEPNFYHPHNNLRNGRLNQLGATFGAATGLSTNFAAQQYPYYGNAQRHRQQPQFQHQHSFQHGQLSQQQQQLQNAANELFSQQQQLGPSNPAAPLSVSSPSSTTSTPEQFSSAMSPPSSGGVVKQKAKRTGRRENLTDDQKRLNHISSEKKRRDLIKKQFDKMCSMVPTLADNSMSNRRSKSDILLAVYDYLVHLVEQNKYIREQLTEHGVHESKLPLSVADMPPQPRLYS